jgi:hypothetical protein
MDVTDSSYTVGPDPSQNWILNKGSGSNRLHCRRRLPELDQAQQALKWAAIISSSGWSSTRSTAASGSCTCPLTRPKVDFLEFSGNIGHLHVERKSKEQGTGKMFARKPERKHLESNTSEGKYRQDNYFYNNKYSL